MFPILIFFLESQVKCLHSDYTQTLTVEIDTNMLKIWLNINLHRINRVEIFLILHVTRGVFLLFQLPHFRCH